MSIVVPVPIVLLTDPSTLLERRDAAPDAPTDHFVALGRLSRLPPETNPCGVTNPAAGSVESDPDECVYESRLAGVPTLVTTPTLLRTTFVVHVWPGEPEGIVSVTITSSGCAVSSKTYVA
jgi:hypothetical protein